jgi:glutamate-ammonia-ligase adenylyltransferase
VAGDKELGANVENTLAKIFARQRNIPAFKKDALFMFNRLKSERLLDTSTKLWRSKLRHGGLMEADYMQSCLKLAGGLISKDLETAIADWNKLQNWERLLGLTAKPITETPARYSNAIDVKNLVDRQKTLEKTVRSVTEAFFADVNHDPNRPARPIVWKN